MSSELDWLHAVRLAEVSRLKDYFPESADTSVLELGSGTGYMLKHFRERYANTFGIEVVGSAYEFQDQNIKIYDGKNIPFKDSSFDLVFSSHVLEHIEDSQFTNDELARVLKPGGLAIHVMPSPTWRFLTSIFHPFAILRILGSFLGDKKSRKNIILKQRHQSLFSKIKYTFWSPRHGTRGNALTELYYFRKQRWINEFDESALNVSEAFGSGIVYWGHDAFRLSLSIEKRKALAKFIGSSSNIFILRKPKGCSDVE